ncbi:hypothetical protein IW140_006634, partial [Coemansia sp. RSA 1813]
PTITLWADPSHYHTSAVLSVTPVTKAVPFSTGFSRTQLPLVLGWPFIVHIVQGLTLKKVCPHARESFAHGMLYTARSRVKRLDDLYIGASWRETSKKSTGSTLSADSSGPDNAYETDYVIRLANARRDADQGLLARVSQMLAQGHRN